MACEPKLSGRLLYRYAEGGINHLIERLAETLKAIRVQAGVSFSGTGILLSDAPERIPLYPIRMPDRFFISEETVGFLARTSSLESEYHDGFHVISSEWHVTRVAQYFSPPIAEHVNIDRTKRFGGRYLAALFGSVLPEVILTGIASIDSGTTVFSKGSEVFYEGVE